MGLLMATVSWAVCMSLTVIIYYRVCENIAHSAAKRKNGCVDPPRYPHKDPILGLDLFLITQRAQQQGQLIDITRQLFKKYGKTFQTNDWGTTVINTMDPRNIQTVLALASDSFGIEPLEQSAPVGILRADGAVWAHSRALIRPIFARPQLTNFASLETHVNKFLDLIPRDGSIINLLPLLNRLFLDTSTEFLFGESIDSLSPATPFNSSHFLQAFDDTLRGISDRFRLGRFKFIRGRDKTWKAAFGRVLAFIDGHVDRVLKQKQSHDYFDNDQPGRYILLNEMAKETQNASLLRWQLLDVFFPAHDLTGVAVSNIVFLLARNPEVWNKLRSEVLANKQEQLLSFELFKSMKYLRYVFNESLRLFPISSRVRRFCHKDAVLPSGGGANGSKPVLVKKGSCIAISMYTMHLSKEIWSEDADEFRPERWETARPTWEYLPFSGGPRICPAQQMVFIESAYVVFRLLQEFSSIENQDPEPWKEEFRMSVRSKNGVIVKMIPA